MGYNYYPKLISVHCSLYVSILSSKVDNVLLNLRETCCDEEGISKCPVVRFWISDVQLHFLVMLNILYFFSAQYNKSENQEKIFISC
jgi:hypothetical protein